MRKPDSCIGCPMYGTGEGYVPDHLVPGSRVFVLMQNPGEAEQKLGLPACGATGEILNKTFLPMAGLHRDTSAPPYPSEVSVGNVLKCRVVDGSGAYSNDLPPKQALSDAVAHCTARHLEIPDSTEIVVAHGALAFQYVTDGLLYEASGKPSSISSWRGFILPEHYQGRPVYATGHLADIFHDPKQWWIASQDWKKLGRILEGGLVERQPPPQRVVTTIDEWAGGYEWFQQAKAAGQPIICDTEYIPDSQYLTLVGLAYRDRGGAIQGLQIDLAKPDGRLRGQLAWQLRELVKTNTMVFHNAIADLAVIEANLGVQPRHYKQIEDTMLAHSVLWGELPHDLDFCGSIYSTYRRLKHLAKVDPLLYNWGDVLVTLDVWEALSVEFGADPAAKAVYQQQLIPLVPILHGAKKRGIRLNHARILHAQPGLTARMEMSECLARIGTGRVTFNVGSDDQLKDWFYRAKQYPMQKNKDTRRPTTDDDAIGVLRAYVGPAFDPNTPLTVDAAFERIAQGADPVLEARVLYVQNEHILNNYFYPLIKKVANAKTDSERRKLRQSCRSQLWGGSDLRERIFPNITTHTQKSGRHSTSNPPLAQLPAEYRDIICPDAGSVWLKWDWSAIEPRLLEALCGSRILRRSFDDGIDLHTWTVCVVFGYPFPPDLVNPHKCQCNTGVCDHEQWRRAIKWQGKDDPRRVFAKTGRYEVWYGGTGSHAAAAAARFGLDKRLLKQAVQKLAASDPDYYRWRCEVESDVKRTRLIRSWGGRPRRFLGQGTGVVREALNHPMQAGVSDIYNLTIIEISQRVPQGQFVFGMHDSQWWAFKAAELTPEVYATVKQIVEQPRSIHGVVRPFPGDFELTDEWSNYYGKSHDLSIQDWHAGQRYTKICQCAGCRERVFIPQQRERNPHAN